MAGRFFSTLKTKHGKKQSLRQLRNLFFPQWRPLQIHLWHLPGLFIGLAAAVFLAAGALPVSLTHETQPLVC